MATWVSSPYRFFAHAVADYPGDDTRITALGLVMTTLCGRDIPKSLARECPEAPDYGCVTCQRILSEKGV
jgi:hypothetical protein